MACAVTALPILILILLMDKLAILRQPLGQRILRYASLDDIAIWGVLALILMDWQRVAMLGAVLAGAVIDAGWFDLRQMDQRRHPVLRVVMPVCFLSTGLRTEWSLGGGAVFAVAGMLTAVSVAGK